MCRVIRLLGLRACTLPVCMAVHASAFSSSARVQAVCLCHSRVSCTLSSPLALAVSSMCLERSWDVSTASFPSTPRALPKYHCSETAQPIYSIKSVLHRPCDPGLAPSLLFSFLLTPHLLKDRIVDLLAFTGLCISYPCPSGSPETEGLALSFALGGVHRTMAVCSRLSEWWLERSAGRVGWCSTSHP